MLPTFGLASRPGSGQILGHVDIELRNQRGYLVANVDVTVEPTTVTLNIIDWTVAVLDRATFRAWLQHPEYVLAVDYSQWSRHGDQLRLRLDGSHPYAVAAATVERLKRLI